VGPESLGRKDTLPSGSFGVGAPKQTRVVGVFPGEGSLVNLATVVMLRATEDWAFRRYMDMAPLWAAEGKPTKIAT
jgi:putative transposase